MGRTSGLVPEQSRLPFSTAYGKGALTAVFVAEEDLNNVGRHVTGVVLFLTKDCVASDINAGNLNCLCAHVRRLGTVEVAQKRVLQGGYASKTVLVQSLDAL